MFEISGSDIAKLCDGDLRSLVARLALAELKTKGCPLSSVTAGGNQDAADGGIDVRVDCPLDIPGLDFVPRRLTGFQVKKPDMPATAIRKEMRPKGVLRDAICSLANGAGAYVIVSSQGSVSDSALSARRKSMRSALDDIPNASQLHTDFYDRERLATWAGEYPGIAAWVRSRVGRPLSGWSCIDNWDGAEDSASKPYLTSDKACLIDERSHDREHLSIAEGIARLRGGLRMPKRCIRLIGLSGNGKTRLIQALFDKEVGEDGLDPSIAIYTDYSEVTDPTARDMARELIALRQRAILVVDNCNPATHSELALLCTSEASKFSLITVEYDVRDDEPERTDVFRLQSASPELVTEWIKQSFPSVSQIDRDKITEFSDGNFRVAGALAETLGRGETLGRLKSSELFERIFRQRNEPNRKLLLAAEDLSLLYSIDGENDSDDGELALLGAIRNVSAQSLYEALVEMRKRGVVQARGPYRAILPQAIANPLAASALDRISPTRFDQFCAKLPPRMLKSVSRRLGFLHDSVAAQSAVARWLQADGPLGDLFLKGAEGLEIITNIAPVLPGVVISKLEHEWVGQSSSQFLSSKGFRRVRLIKAIGYDSKFFERSVLLLASPLPEETHENRNSTALTAFGEFFQLHFSGTQASPEQRRTMIRKLAASEDEGLRRSAKVAMRALLKSGHFTSSGTYDFGARSRDWGWQPKINKDVWDWFDNAIGLVVELATEQDARALLSANFRGLWCYPACHDALERVSVDFSETRPWIEGWIASRATLQYGAKNMPADVRAKLERIINLLKPTDLLNRARAVVLERMPGVGGWDFADGETDEDGAATSWEKADLMAQEVGRALSADSVIRAEFVKELLMSPNALRAFQCGQGLAEGTDDMWGIWAELAMAYGASQSKAHISLLGGYIRQAHKLDRTFTSRVLDGAIGNAGLLPHLPYLQACTDLDVEGIARLRRAVAEGGLLASNFSSIANGSVSKSPPEDLAELLEDIGALSDGVRSALEILHMYFHANRREGIPQDSRLISVGRKLLIQTKFSKCDHLRDYAAGEVISICLAGEEGRVTAEKLCRNIHYGLENGSVSSDDLTYTVEALFKSHPFVALDAFLLPSITISISELFDEDLGTKSPINDLDALILEKWASQDSKVRYPTLGKCLKMFTKDGETENGFSDLFLAMLTKAPNKQAFLGNWWNRLHPRSWMGSLADILILRKAQLIELGELRDEQVNAWLANMMPELDEMIEHERRRDRADEASFE